MENIEENKILKLYNEIDSITHLIPDSFKPHIAEFKKLYENSPAHMYLLNRLLNRIDECGKNQWIIYHELPDDMYMRLIQEESIDCNQIMYDYYKKDNYRVFKESYSRYKNNAILKQHTNTLEQAFEAFWGNKYYNLIVYSLLAIYDGVLDSVTNISEKSYQFSPRLDKIKTNVVSEMRESAQLKLWTFLYTFSSIRSLTDMRTDFRKDIEPFKLNRDWIMHGRSTKKFTEIDCLKIFNFVFSLLYYNNFIADGEIV